MKQSDLNAPCKDCADRHSGCHSECDRYKDYKSNRAAAKKWIKQQSEADSIGCERGIKMRRKSGGINK